MQATDTFAARLAVLDERLQARGTGCECVAAYGVDLIPSYWFAGFEDPPVKACNACFTRAAAWLASGDRYETTDQCDLCRRPAVRAVWHMSRSMADPQHTWVFRMCVECMA